MQDGSLIIDQPQLPAVQEQHQPANDLRHAMMTLPVEHQTKFLTEYAERRDNFRSWLLARLVEGVHYGIVPGCEPKSRKGENGVTEYGVWAKGKNGDKGHYNWYPETQWKPKPSLYAAGADFICDLLGVRDQYESDIVAWQQLGSKAGTAVQKCRLFSKATGDLLGESLGAYSNGYDPNNAVKMAAKCAKVGAVINAYGLRDLFEQEPDARGMPDVNPDEDQSVPGAEPRQQRKSSTAEATAVSKDQFGHVSAHWKSTHPEPTGDLEVQRSKFKTWVQWATKRNFDPGKLGLWTVDDYVACCRALNIDSEAV